MASMIFIKTVAKMNEFVEHYDTLFVTQNGIYSDSGKIIMFLSQDRRTSSEILMIIETMMTSTMVMEGLSLRNMMKKGEDQTHHGHGDWVLDGEANRGRHCSVDVLDNQPSDQKKR